jgi:hypothetical protein
MTLMRPVRRGRRSCVAFWAETLPSCTTERYAHVNSVNADGMLDALGAVVVATNGNGRHSVSLTESGAGEIGGCSDGGG